MLRRWLIRLPFLLALMLVIAMWVWSYFGMFGVSTTCWERYWFVDAMQGSAIMCKAYMHEPADWPRFYLIRGEKDAPYYPVPNTLGFYAGPVPVWGWFDSFEIVFPLWLPTLLLAGLNWLVWRKTKQRKVGQGFPIELSQSPTKAK